MPPKKSSSAAADQARKNDLSTARFVPIEGAHTPEPAPTGAALEAPAAVAADDTTAEARSQDLTSDKKDAGKKEEKDAVTIEDLTLPKSIITRLAKGVLPSNTQIQANAVLAMSKSATVFINYLASHANEHTFNANKKTISPADVFKALDDIEFGFLKEPLEAEFAKFTAMQTEKRNANRKKSAGAKSEDADMADASTISAAAEATADSSTLSAAAASRRDGTDDDGQARATKKQRVGDSAASGGGLGSGGQETEDEMDATVEDERDEDEDEDDEDEVEEEEDEEEGDSGDETQDALEDRPQREDGDEALDGDDSD